MTPFDKFLQLLVTGWRFDLAFFGKAAVILLLVLYLIFSLVVVRQVKLMNKTINGLISRPLVIMSWALVALALVILIYSLIIL